MNIVRIYKTSEVKISERDTYSLKYQIYLNLLRFFIRFSVFNNVLLGWIVAMWRNGSCARRCKVNYNRPHVHCSDKINVTQPCVTFQSTFYSNNGVIVGKRCVRVNNLYGSKISKICGEGNIPHEFRNMNIYAVKFLSIYVSACYQE